MIIVSQATDILLKYRRINRQMAVMSEIARFFDTIK